MRVLLAWAFLLCPAVFAADGPIAQSEPGGSSQAADTGGRDLMMVWREVRKKFRDALFISVSARTLPTGVPLCSPQAPFQNGWRYTFYSKAQDKFIMMASCQGSVAGPLVQMRDESTPKWDVQGRFVDSDVALKTLAASGVDLDPRAHGAGGRRPFSLTLYRLEDERFKTHPVVWKLRIGGERFLVDAVKNKVFAPKDYGVSYDVEFSTAAEFESETLARRPKKTAVFTARKDYEAVMAYAKKKVQGGSLMAIEGFVDAWGGSPCTGPGDGWAYYFYNPKTKGFDAIYACNGFVGPGPMQYIPVDFNLHQPLTADFLDSDKIISSMLIHHPDSMNKPMGGMFERTGTLLLLNYRASPFQNTDHWNVNQIWSVILGRTKYLFDAKSAKLMDVRE